MKRFLIIVLKFLERIVLFILIKIGLVPIIKYGAIIEETILGKIESQIIVYSRFLTSFSTGAIVLSFTIFSFKKVEDLNFSFFIIISYGIFMFSILMGLVFENSLIIFKIKREHVSVLKKTKDEDVATKFSKENWDSFNNWGVQADGLQKAAFYMAMFCLIIFIFINFFQHSDFINRLVRLTKNF